MEKKSDAIAACWIRCAAPSRHFPQRRARVGSSGDPSETPPSSLTGGGPRWSPSRARRRRPQSKGPPMKAMIYHGPGRKAWEDVPCASIEKPTDVVVKIETTTICGTDLHILEGDVPAVQAEGILGHEGVGMITRSARRSPRYRSATGSSPPAFPRAGTAICASSGCSRTASPTRVRPASAGPRAPDQRRAGRVRPSAVR